MGTLYQFQNWIGLKNNSPFICEKHTGFPCSILNTGFPCLIINTDKHEQNTEFFSLKYGSPYIDLNRLEKNFGSFAFRAVLFYLYFLEKIFFVFLCFEGNYCGVGTLYPPPNKIGLKKNYPCYLREKYGFSEFNTKCGSTQTKYGVFWVKIRNTR